MNIQSLPLVGSVVSITTKHPDSYYFSYKQKQRNRKTFVGVVVENNKWLQNKYISVRTDNPNYPIAQISIYNIEKIDIVKAS